MQDLKLKKLICLDKPAENNLVSAAPSPTTDGKTETVAVQPAPKTSKLQTLECKTQRELLQQSLF